MSSYKKRYFSEEERQEMMEQINSLPERVKDEILQRMFEVAYDAVQFKEIYRCESPIEQILSVAISTNITEWMRRYKMPISFASQAEVEIGIRTKYRVDFMIDLWDMRVSNEPNIFIAVECDGHDFHEKTKEQARRDKSRDRDLQAKGITVLRFTGSEIYNETYSCLSDIEKVIERLIGYSERD